MMERAGKNIKRVIIIAVAALLSLCMAGIIMVWADANNSESTPLFKQVLGKAVNFGVVAEHYEQANDLQSNFATNKYSKIDNHGIHSDLTGQGNHAGNYWITSTDANSINFTGNLDSEYYVADSVAPSISDKSKIHIVSEDQLRADVNGLINTALKNGEDLAKQPVTASVEPSKQSDGKVLDTSATLDTTKIDADVIYVDGDQAANYPFDNGTRYVNFLEQGRLTVTKKANQTIVFNFTGNTKNNTSKLTLGRLAVKDQNNSDVNKLDQTEHIIYNVQTTKYSDIDQSELNAVLLVNNTDVRIIGTGTSQGWIVTNGFFSNVGGEWHNIYPGTENITPTTPTEKPGSLKLTKTFATNSALNKDSNEVSGTTFTIKKSDGTVVEDNIPLSKVTAEGGYTKTGLDLDTTYIVTENAPTINGYTLTKTFTVGKNETSDDAEVTLNSDNKDATVAITNDYTKKETKGNLTFTKTFAGDTITDTDKDQISFTVKNVDTGKEVGTYKLGDLDNNNGKYSKTIEVEQGKYQVIENSADVDNNYTVAITYSVNNGNATKDNQTVEVGNDKDATVAITNTYTKKEEKGSLTFTKTFGGDNVTAEDLKNISFTVTGPNNYRETYPLSSMQQKDGTYSKTLTGLTTGNYTVTENNADKVEGYTLVTEQSVTSKGTTVAKDQTATVELKDTYTKNQPNLGSLTFTKSVIGSGITKDDLKNITFTVTGPDNYSKTVALSQMEQGNGSYAYTITGLKEGQYTVTENNADKVEGYTFVSKESVTSRGTTVTKDQTATVELKDSYTPNQTTKKYALKVRKTENIDKKDTNKRIRGSRYAMFRWTGQIAAADAQDNALLGASLRVSNVATTAPTDQTGQDAQFANLIRKDITEANGWKKINESDTDTNGEIEKHDNDITPGVYAVMEEVPPAGYQRTANPAIIRLNEDGSKTMISNANGAAELEYEGAVQFLRWRETATNVEINKVDEKGDSIKGAVLAIYDKGGAPVETWTSDGTKHRITAKLVAGETYTLKELKAPEGYEKAADETFKVESKDIVGIDQYIQGGIKMIDKTTSTTPNQPVKPAQTVAKGVKTGDPTTIGGLIALIAAAGAVTVLTVKRLRDAE